MKINLYFYAALLFWILLQLPTWTFYENVNNDSICKKKRTKKKKDCRPLKRYKLLLHFWYLIYNCYFYIQSLLQFLGSIIYLLFYLFIYLCQSRPVTVGSERPSLCVYRMEETALKTFQWSPNTPNIWMTGIFSARSAGLPHTKTDCMRSRHVELRPLSSCSMITSPRGRYDLKPLLCPRSQRSHHTNLISTIPVLLSSSSTYVFMYALFWFPLFISCVFIYLWSIYLFIWLIILCVIGCWTAVDLLRCCSLMKNFICMIQL